MKPSDLITNYPLKTKIACWRNQHGIPEPSEEELQESDSDFIGFLRVSSTKHEEILSRRSDPLTLRSIVSAEMGNNTNGSRRTSRSTPGHSANLFARRPDEQRRNFMSRILNAASRELDEL
jgi:hypothetical protein